MSPTLVSLPHVLIVNDDPVITMVTARILGNHGYRVSTAKDGQSALTSLKSETPDLMLLDIQMPDMDVVLIQSGLPDDDHRVVTLMECGALGRVSTKTLLGDVGRALAD